MSMIPEQDFKTLRTKGNMLFEIMNSTNVDQMTDVIAND